MISIALAGGGERVVAWEIGVLAGLADAGLDPRTATDIVGTSAGALVAARLAADLDPREEAAGVRPPGTTRLEGSGPSFAALASAWRAAGDTLEARRRAFGRLAIAGSRGGEQAFVARMAARLPAVTWPERLRIVAVDAESGERVAFGAGDGVPLARAVAASRAIPGLLPPVAIGGRRYIDGALGSATNSDLLSGLAVVVAPFSRTATTGAEGLWVAALRDEVAGLERAVVIDADPASLAAMGQDPMSAVTARLAVAAGRVRGRVFADQISPRRAA